MSDFMPLNVTRDVSFINIDLIETIKEDLTKGTVSVTFVSREKLVLAMTDSEELLKRIRAVRSKVA